MPAESGDRPAGNFLHGVNLKTGQGTNLNPMSAAWAPGSHSPVAAHAEVGRAVSPEYVNEMLTVMQLGAKHSDGMP